jgi:glycine/D-amino acid oxidase-like deaminating enzyme
MELDQLAQVPKHLGELKEQFSNYVCPNLLPKEARKLAQIASCRRNNAGCDLRRRCYRRCTAYFPSRRGIEVIVVEASGVAAAVSGKAGGFLALDWCAGTPLDGLARRSFGLHAALTNQIAGDWGYRPMTAYSGFVVPDRDARRHRPADLDWLSDGVTIASRLGTTETTAIVHPRAFTSSMMAAAQRHAAELRRGRVTGIVRSLD